MEPDLHKYLNKIIHGDAIEVMLELPPASIPCIVTSPPYNLLNSTGNGLKSPSSLWASAALKDGYDNHSDAMDDLDYILWQRNCLAAMMRLLTEDGVIFYNHKWRVQNGLLQDRSLIVKDFPVRQIIIWNRGSGMNFNKSYFLPCYEVIYMICNPKFRLTESSNGRGDVWSIPLGKKNSHPAPFPVALPQICIQASKGAHTVLDPFIGSGSTAIAAERLGVNYIGIEQSFKYCALARKRIRNEKRTMRP